MVDPLIIDLYPKDRPLDAAAFIAAGPPWCGAVFKLSQGTRFRYDKWAYQQRQPFLRSDRYGHDLFDGYYHYLELDVDGRAQAEWFWSLMEQIGGEKIGTLWAMLDVERGGQRIADPTKQQVVDCSMAWAERYEQLSGRKATLYGGELLRALQVGSLMGCGRSAVALYGQELHGKGESTAQFLARTGTDVLHLMQWQYTAAEGKATGPAGYPTEAPGIGRCDISALVLPGGLDRLRATLWAERP